MPRSVQTSRVIAEATIATANIPGSSGDTVTVAVTVPTRGFIHRVTLIWGTSSAHPGTEDTGGCYLHTSGAAGAGATPLSSAQAQTIFGQAFINPDYADLGGGALAIGSSVFVYAPVLDFAYGMPGSGAGVQPSITPPSGGGPAGMFYDVSGTTLGPTQGTGTIYFTWIGGADMTANAIFCKVRFEIEPCA
jgi:hypothetical protein